MKLLYIWQKPNDSWQPPQVATTTTDSPQGEEATQQHKEQQ
jgi:hypothetical protein